MTIVFIGAGNLATSLASALQRAGHRVMQIWSRTRFAAEALAEKVGADATDDIRDIRPDADLYIYALADAAYPMKQVAKSGIHVLTAGSVPYDALQGEAGKGILYPFQSFSKASPISNFRDIPILVEGSDEPTHQTLRKLALSLSDKVYDSTPESRARLHMAGVLANNFTNCLYALAEEQLRQADLPFDILLPLIDETARKVHRLPPREAQTGPAVRRDKQVMQRHLDLLTTEEEKELYRLLSDIIMNHARSK